MGSATPEDRLLGDPDGDRLGNQFAYHNVEVADQQEPGSDRDGSRDRIGPLAQSCEQGVKKGGKGRFTPQIPSRCSLK